jgi:sugar lactone lactonase YvrE
MNNLEISKELVLRDVTRVHGVTFDGRALWFAADDGDLVEMDPESGDVLSRTALGAKAGVTYDGEAIWAICGQRIDRIDPKTRAVVRSIPAPPGQLAGLAWAEGALWIGLYGEKKILKVDPENGRVLKSIALDRLVTGVTWAAGELWHGTVGTERGPGGLHRVDPTSGKELEHLAFSEKAGASGIEYDPTRRVFFCGANDGGESGRAKIRAVRAPVNASSR